MRSLISSRQAANPGPAEQGAPPGGHPGVPPARLEVTARSRAASRDQSLLTVTVSSLPYRPIPARCAPPGFSGTANAPGRGGAADSLTLPVWKIEGTAGDRAGGSWWSGPITRKDLDEQQE